MPIAALNDCAPNRHASEHECQGIRVAPRATEGPLVFNASFVLPAPSRRRGQPALLSCKNKGCMAFMSSALLGFNIIYIFIYIYFFFFL